MRQTLFILQVRGKNTAGHLDVIVAFLRVIRLAFIIFQRRKIRNYIVFRLHQRNAVIWKQDWSEVAEYILLIYVCYLPAGRSVLGKTVPEVLSTQDRGHSFSPIRADLGRQITCLFFSVEYFVSSFCVEFSLQPFSNLVYACVCHLANRK